jgi:hypothetical protein
VFYVLLLVIAALGGAIYLLFILQNVPGMAEERLGVLEPLPPDVGEWKRDEDSEAARGAAREGLIREVRTFFDEPAGKLFRQVRYRSAESGQIVRTEPDERLKRRRVKPS